MMQQNTSYSGSKIRLYLGSTALFIGMILSSLLICPLIIIAYPLSFSVRYRISDLWVVSILWMAKMFCGLDYEVEGAEFIKQQPVAIVLSKHQSAWETIALRHILPMQATLLKRSLLWIPVWGWAMAALKPIAIDRTNQHGSLRILISKGTKHLQQGLWLVIFPEGTRTAPDEVKKFNAGGALLAQKTGYPVIPIAHNAGIYWPRYSFLKYPGTIKVKIGAPINTQGRKAADINAQAHAWIIQAMQEINAKNYHI